LTKFWKPILKFLVWFITALFAIGIVLQLFFVDLAVVGHNGMVPTMQAGERVVIWNGQEFELGDIAVCTNPENPNDLVMARVVGKPGMTVRTVRGGLEIEGTVPDIDFGETIDFIDPLHDRTDRVQRGTEILATHTHGIFVRPGQELVIREVTVEEGRLYLLGDNRFHSADDSRNFGTVDIASCLGKVVFRISPAENPPTDLGNGWLEILR
jgi:signal peptidase I